MFTPSEDLAQEKQEGRGITHMKKLIKARSDAVKEMIRYNQWGQALDQEGSGGKFGTKMGANQY